MGNPRMKIWDLDLNIQEKRISGGRDNDNRVEAMLLCVAIGVAMVDH